MSTGRSPAPASPASCLALAWRSNDPARRARNTCDRLAAKRRRPWVNWAMAILTVAGLLVRPAFAGDAPLTVEPIAEGVYLHHGLVDTWRESNRGDIANLGFIVGERCVAVIDTGSTLAVGQRLLAAVRAVTDKPVCHVINTHAHPDHMLGNAAFEAEAATFIGHANLAGALATRGPAYLNAVHRDLGDSARGTRLTPAGRAVSDSLTIDLGDRPLTIKAWPTSHTDADLTVFDQKTATLWLGDLAFVDHLPVVDGKLNGWLETIGKLRRIPAQRAVPGHGRFDQPGWPAMLDAQERYLLELRTTVRAAIANGQTLSDALAKNQAGHDEGWSLRGEFHQRNVSAAFAELEWE